MARPGAAGRLARGEEGRDGGGTDRRGRRLPRRVRLLYASGSLGANVLFQTVALWLVYFYAPPAASGRPALVPIAWVGALLGLGRVLSALEDPLIGHWSDRTRSRWGRRLPFIVLGTPLLLLSFLLLWTPPLGTPELLLALYFFLLVEGFSLSYSAVFGPYEALLPELARTAPDRLSVSAWKVLFGTVGGALGLVGSGLLIQALGFVGMALVLAALTGASFAAVVVGLGRIPPLRAPDKPLGLGAALRATCRNRPFLAFTVSILLLTVGQNLLTQVVPYFVQVALNEPEDRSAWLLATLLGSVLLALPLVTRFAARNKRRAYLIVTVSLGLLLPLLGLVGLAPGVPPLAQALVLVALLGPPAAGLYVFPTVLLADIVDHDARLTGQRREAIYYGLFGTLTKAAFAGAAVLFGAVLGAFGYSASQPWGVRLVGPLAGLCVLAAAAVFAYGYRLDERGSHEF